MVVCGNLRENGRDCETVANRLFVGELCFWQHYFTFLWHLLFRLQGFRQHLLCECMAQNWLRPNIEKKNLFLGNRCREWVAKIKCTLFAFLIYRILCRKQVAGFCAGNKKYIYTAIYILQRKPCPTNWTLNEPNHFPQQPFALWPGWTNTTHNVICLFRT